MEFTGKYFFNFFHIKVIKRAVLYGKRLVLYEITAYKFTVLIYM
ncbi:MAG: hypothetical protein Faunusvirus1_6 [Faunusvirus sp.]|uniref:Uncharacterized protein n=1 Tax=Faunusvirus sp. TaxID=2487766 RepID=A0A3G4ZVS7_9VIRU|nr:MAG: hypothetical protein Faunusvirus1_6 [Faunusvirus sp.]